MGASLNSEANGEVSACEEGNRPWGIYEILDSQTNFKVKRVVVLPGKRLSYQSHEKRAEHWFIVQGSGEVTLNGENFGCTVGDTFDIEIGKKHRIHNTGVQDLIFIEVQTGTYFGEDDICRYEDDFGRIS